MSGFQIDPLSRVPIYEQLKKQVLRLGALGLLDPEEALPSVRQMAADLGINPNTVQKAYRELEREELIITVPGKGSFLAATEQHVQRMKSELIQRLCQLMLSAREAGFSEKEFCTLCEEAVETVYGSADKEQEE